MTPINITPAHSGDLLAWATEMVIEHHYLHTRPDPRTRSVCFAVHLGNTQRVGCLWFGRPEATCCYRGGLTYGSLDDVRSKRAAFDRWEVLNLGRVWLSPDVQPGGQFHNERFLPGFKDRNGEWRSSFASTVIKAAIQKVGYEYLLAHPPCFVEQPYMIRAVMSYCNRKLHRGVIYRAAGFQLARVNHNDIETWWTPAVAPLTRQEDRRIRGLAARHPRSMRIRAERELAAK